MTVFFPISQVSDTVLLIPLFIASRSQKRWLYAGGVRIHLPFTRPQTFSDQTRCVPVSLPGKHAAPQTQVKPSNWYNMTKKSQDREQKNVGVHHF